MYSLCHVTKTYADNFSKIVDKFPLVRFRVLGIVSAPARTSG